MNPKQEIIKNLIQGLPISNLGKLSLLTGRDPFRDWLKSVSVALKAARMQWNDNVARD